MQIATIADLVERIPVLWNSSAKKFGVNAGILNQILSSSSEITLQELKPYYGLDLKLAEERFTFPLKLTANDDSFSESWGLDLSAITKATSQTAIQNEAIILEATSETDFIVRGTLSGNLGEGDKGSDFASADGSFSILAAHWSSEEISFTIGDRWIFSRTFYEHTLHLLSSLHAAHFVILGRYMSEASNDLDLGNNSFMDEYKKLRDSLINYDSPTTLLAPNASYANPNFVEKQDWQSGYDIDHLGNDI